MSPGRKTRIKRQKKNRQTFRQRGGFSIGELRKILRNIQGIREGGRSLTEATVAPLHAQLRDLLAKRSSSNIDPGLSAVIARLLGAASRPEEYVAILAELDRRIPELEDAEINVEGGVYPYQNLVAPFDISDLRDLLRQIMNSTTSSQRSIASRVGLFSLIAPCKTAVRRIPDKEGMANAYGICLLLDHYNGSPAESIPDVVIGFYQLLSPYVTAGQFSARRYDLLRDIVLAPLESYSSTTLGAILTRYLSPLYALLSEPQTIAYLRALPPGPPTNAIYEIHDIIINIGKYLKMTINELVDELLTQLAPYVSSRRGPAGIFPDPLYYQLTDIRQFLSNNMSPTPERIDAWGREVLAFLRQLPPKYTTVAVTVALRHPPHFEDLADLQEFARPLQISLARIVPDFRYNRDMRSAAAGDNPPRKRRIANAELYEDEVNLGAASRNNVGNLLLPPAAAAANNGGGDGRGRIRRGVIEIEPPAPHGVKILKETNFNGELPHFNLLNNNRAAAVAGSNKRSAAKTGP
jgi:hypothetical protein